MVSRFESAAVASNHSTPEQACCAMLQLILNEDALRLCNIGNPSKVELFADVFEAISGIHNIINCEMRPQL